MQQHLVFIETSISGAGQVAYRVAKQRGYQVTLLSKEPGKYGKLLPILSDNVHRCDTNDLKALEAGILALNDEQTIDGITTTADFYVPQAAYAANLLGLPSLTYQAAASVRNKYHMRQILQRKVPHLNPPFAWAGSRIQAQEFADREGYPFICKPLNGNDSLYVKLVHSDKELDRYFEQTSSWGKNDAGQDYSRGVLLEGYVDGREMSTETAQAKGGARQLIGVTANILTGFEEGHFAEVGAYFPHRGPETERLFEGVNEALDVLEIDCGVIHTECRLLKDSVKIIEVNPRLIGDRVGSHVIEQSCGRSALEPVVDIPLGNFDAWCPVKQGGSAIYGVTTQRNGRFVSYDNLDDIRSLPGVVEVEPIAKPGQLVRTPTNNADILALVIAEDTNPRVALQIAQKAARKCRFTVQELAS